MLPSVIWIFLSLFICSLSHCQKMCTKRQRGRTGILSIHFKRSKDDISLKGLCFQLTECLGQGYCLDCDFSISHHTKAWPYYISSDLRNVSAMWTVNANAALCFFPALQKWEKILRSWIYTHSRFGSIQLVCHKGKQILNVWECHRKSLSSCDVCVNAALRRNS